MNFKTEDDFVVSSRWHRSTRCGSDACVEVATVDRIVGVRDSRDRQGPVLVFRFDEWTAFLAGVRDGEFDLNYVDPPSGHRKHLTR
jgi:hypothetical protein